MSLAVLADHMASKGRNGDSMLVHMAPEEVAGLHALALSHGGELTINPETGLPEAFSLKGLLKSLLPAIAGFALAPLTAGTSLAFLGATPLASALTVGGVTGLAKGSLKEGIMAGLGAYGGASLGAGLSAAGEAGLQAAAGEAALKETAGYLAEAPLDAAKFVQQQVAEKAAAMTPYDKIAAGVSNLGSEAGRQNLMASFGSAGGKGAVSNMGRAAMYALAPAAEQMLAPPNVQMPSLTQNRGMYRGYTYDPYGGTYIPQEPTYAANGGIVALANGGTTDDPTQRATPTEAQLTEQRRIVADPQAAALAAARSGIASGLTNQQIADVVNSQYGKSFSAQNVADFIEANKLRADSVGGGGGTSGGTSVVTPTTPVSTSPVSTSPVSTSPVSTSPVSTSPVTSPVPVEAAPVSGTTPVPVTYGQPFTPTPQTMGQVRDVYTQGGGNIEMPNIGTVAPGERVYTQNQVVQALQRYMADNPNAQINDIQKISKELGVPQQQLRAAINEYRFGSMTGGSRSAYDYLMGRGDYPIKPFTPTGELMRPYAEAVLGAPENIKAKRYLFDQATQKYVLNPNFVPRTPSTVNAPIRDQAGNPVGGATESYFKANPDVYQTWLSGTTGMTADAYAKFHWDTFGQKEGRKGWTGGTTSGGSGGSSGTGEVVTGGKAGGIMQLADGGAARNLGYQVNYGTPFEQAAAEARAAAGMPTSFEALQTRYTPQQVQAPAPAPAPAAASAAPAAGFSAFSPQVQAILDRPRPTVQQEIARLSVPSMEDTKARGAFEQKLASQVTPRAFTELKASPTSVLNPAFNAQVEANLRGRAELERLGLSSKFGSTFLAPNHAYSSPEQRQTVADIDPWLKAIEIERPMGGQITENRDLNALLNEYMTSALAGNTSRAQGAFARMNTLGLSGDSIRGMVRTLDPEFDDKIYNMNFDPITKTIKGPLGYQGFEQYFSPGSGGWKNIAQDKARYGYTDEDIAYGLGLSTKEVKDALAAASTGMARGGLADVAAAAAARGGNVQQYNLGGYSDGGRLLRGPGDGVSDSIPATIGNRQPARLADGEFVIPARIVSEIGNGSTEAGARKLYAMMDRVQRARAKTTGKGKVAKNTRADKYLPA